MCEKVQLKRCIYEVNFGYSAKTGVYANSSSDITKINKISPLSNKLKSKNGQQREKKYCG
jgi:hypothetical protein